MTDSWTFRTILPVSCCFWDAEWMCYCKSKWF